MSLRFLGFWDISISRNYNQILSFKLCNFWVVTVSRYYNSILSLGFPDFFTPCNCHVTGEAQYLRPVRCPSYLDDNARMHKKFDALRVTLWPWGLHQMDMHLTIDLAIISTMCLQLDLWQMSKTLQHYATWVTLVKNEYYGFCPRNSFAFLFIFTVATHRPLSKPTQRISLDYFETMLNYDLS